MEKSLTILLGVIFGCLTIMLLCGCSIFVYLFAVGNTVNTDYPDSSNNDKSTSKSSNTSGTKCYSEGKVMEKNAYVTAVIGKVVDGGQSAEYITTRSFRESELVNYTYGVLVKDNPEGYYVQYELCDRSNDNTLNFPQFKKESYLYYKEVTGNGAVSSSMGSNTNFAYSDNDGSIKNTTKGSGNYSIDAFAATTDGSWKWVDSLTFSVE